MREGRWDERMQHFGTGLSGRVLGSIGVGNIGAELFRLAAPFGMRHIACDPYVTQQSVRPLGVTLVDLDTLFREADFLCVNCPLNDETRRLVGARQLALMKPTAYFVNTARGPIVDEQRVLRSVGRAPHRGRRLGCLRAGTHATGQSTAQAGQRHRHPHHICLTDECIDTVTASVFSACRDLAHGRVPRNVVNQQVLGRVPYFHA